MATTADTSPPMRFYSFRPDAPLPHPCNRYDLHPAAFPLCIPHREALDMGQQLDSPLDWALARTEAGMRVGWIAPDDSIDWQTPDELGNVYHPEGASLLDGLPVDNTRAKKIIVPGRGLQFANVKDSRPGFIEVITGMVFAPGRDGWGLRVGWPSGTPMPPGLEVPHAFFRSWYQAPFPTVYHLPEVGTVVRFRRGDTMAALVPLPDVVMEGNRTDGRAVSAGVAEWPAWLRTRVATVTGAIFSRTGGYSATTHRADKTGVCPFGHVEPAAPTMPTLSPKRMLAACLDDLDVTYGYLSGGRYVRGSDGVHVYHEAEDGEDHLLLLAGDRSSDVARLLADEGVHAVRVPGGVRLFVGSVEQNAHAVAVLEAAGARVPRGARTWGRMARTIQANRTYGQPGTVAS